MFNFEALERIHWEMKLIFQRKINVFDEFVSEDVCEKMLEPSRRAFTAKALDASDGETYSSGSTFFLKGSEEPSSSQELLARAIYDHHIGALESHEKVDPENSGAEWWTQVIDTRDDIGIHWDRDYGAEEATSKHIYPYLATVTYLKGEGGATVVFDTVGTTHAEDSLVGRPCKWFACSYPKRGKHLCFDGRLLHAAPSDFRSLADAPDEGSSGSEEDEEEEEEQESDDEEASTERITFLVNLWINHVPMQSRRFRPGPQDKLLDGKQSSLLPIINSAESSAVETAEVLGPSGTADDEVNVRFSNGVTNYRVRVYMPVDGLCPSTSSEATTRLVDCSGCASKVVEDVCTPAEKREGVATDGDEYSEGEQGKGNNDESVKIKAGSKRKRGAGVSAGMLTFVLPFFILIGLIKVASTYVVMPHVPSTRTIHAFDPIRAKNPSRHIPDSMQKRIEQGTANPGDMRRTFKLTKREMHDLQHNNLVGQIGIIIRLEGILVDMTTAYLLVLTQLAREFKKEPPSVDQVKDVIGLSMKDTVITLGWDLSGVDTKIFALRFQETLVKLLDAIPIRPYEGASEALDQYITDGNQVTILTALPREVAVRALSKSGLSPVLERRVDASNLVHADDAKDRLSGQQLVRSIAQMQTPLELAIYIDANVKGILAAKRVGVTVAGVRNLARDLYSLRTADTVIGSMKKFPPRALYTIISKSYANNMGPTPEPQVDADAAIIKTKTFQAPAVADDNPRDTFADEFGADLL